MKKFPSEIRHVVVAWEGDESVGIFRHEINIGDPTDHSCFLVDLDCYDQKEVSVVLDEFRQKLADAFEVIGDGRPSVTFDFEFPGQEYDESKRVA